MRFEDEQVQYSPGQNGEHLKGEGILVLSTLRPLRDVMRMLEIIVVIWILGAFLKMHVQWFKGCESKRVDGRFSDTF